MKMKILFGLMVARLTALVRQRSNKLYKYSLFYSYVVFSSLVVIIVVSLNPDSFLINERYLIVLSNLLIFDLFVFFAANVR
jgi:hypothetical protein